MAPMGREQKLCVVGVMVFVVCRVLLCRAVQTIRENIDIFMRNGFDFVDRGLQPAGGGQQGTHRQQQQGASSDQQHQQRLWSKPPRSKAAAAAAAAGDAAAAAATGRDGCGGDSQQQQQEQIQQPLEEEQASGFGVDVDAEGCGRSELLLSMVPVLKSGASGGEGLPATHAHCS